MASELQSRQLGRGGSDTLIFDATASPSVATPSAPQRYSRTSPESGGHHIRVDETAPTPRNGATCGTRQEREDISAINRDLLVISLEEENDRLRSALDSEHRVRQLAEARAHEAEKQARDLALQLSEAQQKLEDLEHEAFRRAMVQTWLDTATPQRCGSVDQGPEESIGAVSAVLVDARVCTDFGATPAAAKLAGAAALVHSHHSSTAQEELDAEASAAEGKASTRGDACAASSAADEAVEISCTHAYDDLDLGGNYGSDAELLHLHLTAPTPAIHREVSACGASPHVLGGDKAAATTAAAGTVQVTGMAPAAAGPFQRSCTLADERSRGGSGDGLSQQWSWPLQGEERRPPSAVPLSHVERPPRQAQPQEQRLCTPPGSSGEPAAAAAATAGSIWMPAGAALGLGLGFEPASCGAEAPPAGQSSRPAAAAAAAASAAVPGGRLAPALSAPSGSPHFHPCPLPQQHPVLWQGSLRVPDRARLRGSGAMLRSAFNVAAGGYDGGSGGGGGGGGGAAIQSCGSAPVGAQDGGDWCNIPLGSPACSPRKGAGLRAGNL